MAPHTLRDLSPSSFKPRVVSIGPLHKKDENVQELEGRKTSYMIDLMHHTNSPQKETLKTCLEKVYLSMDQIKACYIWTDTYDDSEIAKMLVMDACFILHYILSYHFVAFEELDSGNAILRQSICYDLVLLENQIPFFIVDQIFQCIALKFIPNTSLIELIHPILSDLNLFEADIDTDNISISNTCHILSILHQCYKPQRNNYPSHDYSSKIHSAVDLDMAGVCFKPNQNPTWVLGMEVKLPRVPCFFWCWSKPTLRMPAMIVGDDSEFIFRNLMAYELSCTTSKHITSYSYAIDMLVNNSKDVAKLVDSRVLLNFMGSNEEVANMINNLGRDVWFKPSIPLSLLKPTSRFVRWPGNHLVWPINIHPGLLIWISAYNMYVLSI
ncbi:hypothetical protein QVD17_17391 [Tagetes erecta]|uniref:Uncharacterized protein n=1 Tax=Tagetes erecta TaxID=13708 RepID=A0AAD8KS65_TARER|nr:hypothetical protein QVD17_17391 [Tagetes erecta]